MTKPEGNGPNHTEKRGSRAKPGKSRARGKLEVRLIEGSVFDPKDRKPIGVAQKLRVTVLFADDAKVFRKKKTASAPAYKVQFDKVPVGRYVVVVENVSATPSYPGAVAEVRVTHSRKASAPPIVCKVKLSTDSIGTVARKCGFRVGALEGIPERGAATLGDQYANHFNARIILAFWSPSNVLHVPAPPVTAGQSLVVMPTGPDQAPFKRTNWDGIPTLPPPGAPSPFGTPSLAMLLPANDPPSSLPMNLFAIRDDRTYLPLSSGGKEIFGLVQAEKDGDGGGIEYGPDNRLQITFVRHNGPTDANLEVVPPEEAPKGGIRYYRHRPPLDSMQYTALLWKSGNCAPPARLEPINSGAALIAKMDEYVRDTLHVHKADRGEQQYVVVNEPLLGRMGTTSLGKSKVVTAFLAARKKGAKALFQALGRKKIPPAVLNRWLAQSAKGESEPWLHRIDRSIKYILSAYEAAAPADKEAVLILNEHSCESLELSKGLALAALMFTVRERIRKKTASGARRLAVGFQMHLKDNYYGKKKRKAFLDGLQKAMDYYTRSLKMRVYITEMSVRMPGFAGVEQALKRIQTAFTLSKLIELVRGFNYEGGATPADPLYTVRTETKDGVVRPVEITLKLAKDRSGNEAVITMNLDTGVIARDGMAAGKPAPPLSREAIQAWENEAKAAGAAKSNAEIGKSMYSHLRRSAFANVNIWGGGYAAAAEGAVPKVSARQRREQADMFYKVVRTCLSSPLCNDLNFWGVADAPLNDNQDLFGFLFSRPGGAGALTPGLPYLRKPAYFAALQGMIEAAIAKEKAAITRYALAHRRSAITRRKHAYEAHLSPTF